jgi:serine/threonine-protein kinase HipA
VGAEAASLPVSLVDAAGAVRPVGLLARDAGDGVTFTVSHGYLDEGPDRPVLSARWWVPGDEAATRARLRSDADKMARFGLLPPWFSNLLPEGALRDMVERGMPSGRISDFDVIRHLGADLPGGVLVGEGFVGGWHMDARLPGEGAAPDRRPQPEGPGREPPIRFSLAGVQLKFSSVRRDERLTVPSVGASGDLIVKLPNARYPGLVELEFAALSLAAAAGVEVADFEMADAQRLDGVPERLVPGPSVLVLKRFDRTGRGRVHAEDFAQIMGAVGDQKYTRGNDESCVKIVQRFSRRGRADVEQAVRRLVVNLLLGNTDAHLKNWSLLYDAPEGPRLSPAYDIVALRAIEPTDRMALKLRGKADPAAIDEDTFVSFAKFVDLPDRAMRRIVRETVERAVAEWPRLSGALPLSAQHATNLRAHWQALALVRGAPPPF